MSKAQATRERILQQTASLFNQQGYAGCSMSDIMRVTGLQKGGIYNHFKSKDELALAAFDFSIHCISQNYMKALKGKRNAIARLHAIVDVLRHLADDPPIAGGCPILNTAIESDDTHPALRQRAQQALENWQNLIRSIINKGIVRGEVRPTVDADTVSTIMIATLEGAIMMSKLYDDQIHVQRAVDHITDYIERSLKLS
jgi:TetR/AcrR family transcriptional regulator, transcriptional repressor for nem operon